MDARRQHHAVHAPLQSQQFPPLLHPQAGGQPPRQPLPLPHSYFGLGPRPSSFSGPAHPLAGQKRNSMALHHRPADGAGFAKLFVGSLPRNISEEEVRGLFGEYGNVVEVVFLKDKKTGLPQGCCFIKYETAVEAERAIRALDNQRTLQGGSAPLQVKFADGERDHPGPLEHKLFVGSLSKQATEQEIEEIFAPFGRVENVYVIRDEHKQSRGCAFVTFPDRDMAIAAISALNGVYRMAGCHQSIIVRFADPKRPRSGEASRMGGTGPNYSPHSSQGAGGPRGSGGQAMGAHSPAFGWRQGGGPSGMGLLPQTGILPLGTPVSTSVRGGPLDGPNTAMGMRAGGGSIQASQVISGPIAVSGVGAQLSQQQGFKESSFHRPGQMFGQQVSLHQQPPQQFLPSTAHHNQLQPLQGFPLAQSTDTRLQQPVPLGHYSSAQPTVQVYGQTSVSHHQLQQQVVTSIQQPITTLPSQQLQLQPPHQLDSQQNQQPIVVQTGQPLPQVQQQIPSLQQVQQQIAPLQPLPSQLQQQVVVKETSQQPYLNPLQMTSLQPVTVQPSWSVPVQQQVVTSVAAPTIASVSVTPAPVTATCEWTEHTSPEGHKYYYNSSTGESRWEKPEEFAAYERQQQQQQPQPQPQPQQQQQQQLPHHHQQQQVQAQAQVQTHVQQLQPQHLNYQYQQQQVLNHQPQQQAPSQQLQHYQQQHQPQMQQLHQQQPQLQQPQLQQPQQQPQLQQPQRETQFPYSGVTSLQYTQPLSGGTYQPVQGYAQGQPANGMVDPSRGAHQQFPPSQQVLAQIPSANGMPDIARGAQWIPAIQQGLPNQEWMWKSKPTGS